MADERISTSTPRTSQRILDLDTSAFLIAERLIGEILSWDLVDWAAIEPYKGKRFHFGRRMRGDPSICDRLKPLFDRCDPESGDFSALKPSPPVNAGLTRLVGYLCRHVGRDGALAVETNHRALERTEAEERLHIAAIDRMLRRVETDPDLRSKALLLKRISAAAENELERHFADLINDRMERTFLPNGVMDRYKIDRLRQQARERVEETRALNEGDLFGLATPDLAFDDEALITIEMARILLGRFPYVRNYELMLHAELAMLQQPMTPRFARERVLGLGTGAVDEASIGRWDRALAGMARHLGSERSDPTSCCENRFYQGGTMAICGSGSLPMTALFLHLFTGAGLVLIDDDRTAVERSTRLIANLEQLDILKPGALKVQRRNAADAVFHAAGTDEGREDTSSIGCDAVMIASLVDRDAKTSIAQAFRNSAHAPALLIMRSATGLSARLAYDPVPTEAFSCTRLAYCGETLPATHLTTHLDRAEAASLGVASVKSPDVLAIAHPDVVNTTEVFRRLPVLPADADVNFGSFTTLDDGIGALERAGGIFR